MGATVLSAVSDGVRTITLNRPERLNAIDRALLAELRAALAEAQDDAGTRAIVLRGAGRAFCSGDDLEDFGAQCESEAAARRFLDELQDITRLIVLGDKMVVGAVHGWAVGGGLEWAIDCDLLLMAEGTRCFFPEVRWGMMVTGGVSAILPRVVGLARARELILFGDRFDAAQALAMGLAWRVVPGDALFDEAAAVAARVAGLPPAAVRDVKHVLNRACHGDVEQAVELEKQATLRGFLDPETAARVAAFKT